MTVWHTHETKSIVNELKTDPHQGLETNDAAHRLTVHGLNELKAVQKTHWWKLLLGQFKNTLVIILLAASVLSGVLGHGTEAIAITIIVLFSVVLGFIQEFRAGRALEALQEMAAPTALVLRGGKELEIAAKEVVPGDIILIATGNKIPADARILEAVNLKIDEASLTGESVPVEKNNTVLTVEKLPVGDRKNMVYAGTHATYGRGSAVVVATGMQTEFGAIAGLLQKVETAETPLQKNLDKVGKTIARAALVVVVIIVGLGVLRGQPFLEMFIFGIALAVAVVPEALPAVVTISLAIGVQRMVKRNALVRRLPAVETLGSTSIIASDKTGTLTKDEMTVRKVYLPEGMLLDVSGSGYAPEGEITLEGKPFMATSPLSHLLQAGVLSSDARLFKNDEQWEMKGDPTEGALVVLAAKLSIDKELLDETNPRTGEIPFSSETKRMTTLHQVNNETVAYSKGALEIILASSTFYMTVNGPSPLTDTVRTAILSTANTLANQALRLIGLSYKPRAELSDAENEMIFLGMVGMIDPPRPEAQEAIKKCQAAGIKLMMITGDHPLTAGAIARELGLLRPNGLVVMGVELDTWSDEKLQQNVENVDVFARVSPAHKLRVVAALQSNQHVVAMTGDGVNDAPALKKADIGVAMGITGTDVTKEAAAMTLTDDNFASIVAAVEEGRIIYGNIKKYLMYLLSSNIGEIGLFVGASVLGLPLPLTAVQILYVNLATDGLPALALAVDPPETDLMDSPPRPLKSGIFTKSVSILMVAGGVWSALINITLFVWARYSGRSIAETMTMVFVSLVLIQFFKAYNFRSDHHSVLKKPFANKWLNRAVLWELVVLLLIIYVPWLQKPFGTFSLSLTDWVIVTVLASTVSIVLEVIKRLIKRFHV